MMKVRGCKKCQGTLILDKDEFGWYEQCIQCGYTHDIPLDIPLDKALVASPITVTVINDPRDLVDKWKHNKLPTFKPIKKITGPVEDTY